jgi:DNA-binding MarR family transcriptional regulator
VQIPPAFEAEFPDASALATEAFLNVGILTGAVRSAVDRLVTEAGAPSMAAFNVLSVLAGDPSPLRPSIIASRMLVSRATITGVLDVLERRRLVRRRPSGDDGRGKDVVITAAGRRLVDDLVPRVHRFERELMGALGDDQLRDLTAMVAVLQHRMAELDPRAAFGV